MTIYRKIKTDSQSYWGMRTALFLTEIQAIVVTESQVSVKM